MAHLYEIAKENMKRYILSALAVVCIQFVTAQVPTAFPSAVDAMHWVHQEIRYDPSLMYPADRLWSPERTVREGRGVCRDQTILLVYILRHLGLDAKMEFWHTRKDTYHTIVIVGGYYLDPTYDQYCTVDTPLMGELVLIWDWDDILAHLSK